MDGKKASFLKQAQKMFNEACAKNGLNAKWQGKPLNFANKLQSNSLIKNIKKKIGK